jgi:hypothetical protein
LATSDDGVHFTPLQLDPIILGNETKEYPYNYGVAGGGSIVEEKDASGAVVQYRQYYTLAVGSTSKDVKADQKKVCARCSVFRLG